MVLVSLFDGKVRHEGQFQPTFKTIIKNFSIYFNVLAF